MRTGQIIMKNGLLFGTAGTPLSSRSRASVDGIRRIRELGLDCMELEFVRGVNMGRNTARDVIQVAIEKSGIAADEVRLVFLIQGFTLILYAN